MSAGGHEDVSGKVASLRAGVEQRAGIPALVDETHYEDLEHILLGLRSLVESAEHAGLSGHIHRSPDRALHASASDLASRLEALAEDASAFSGAYPNEETEIAVTALAVARGSLEEVTERYEMEHA